ncbi:MAG: hypothetical protein J2P45_08830, partial [Candidatus Dormibacteraeota bacterium]|nr:hypothetical protein [Candidatus Dormibacteraeota bacterium]
MRGSTDHQVTMLALVDPDQLIPADHPIRRVKPDPAGVLGLVQEPEAQAEPGRAAEAEEEPMAGSPG